MRAVDVITNKRDGLELSPEEINFFISGFAKGEIPDYQAAALAMAIFFIGMSARETVDLTLAMAKSGEVLDLSTVIAGMVVDKHSTGGVGDKTTLVAGPIVAACGVPMGKMSGRGLGYSGGTLDKMESFPGYDVQLTTDEFKEQLASIGLVLAGQSADLGPADGKLYALRDVTGTVPSIPLIAASIMSKKIAGGAQAIVLDVKVGSGAFMQTMEDARALAQTMVDIGAGSNRRVVALLSDMNQPLGFEVGNALEVMEAIATLRGDGPPDFTEHALRIADNLVFLAGRAETLEKARELTSERIQDGSGLEKFKQLVQAQGGDTTLIDDVSKFPRAEFSETWSAPTDGYVGRIDARKVGEAAVLLGAGRARKSDLLDLAVGITVHAKVSDKVKAREPVFTLHANDQYKLYEAKEHVIHGIEISTEPSKPLPLFYGSIDSS